MTEGRIPSATKTLVAVALAVPVGLAIGAAVGASDGSPTDIAVRQVSAGRLDDASTSSSTSSTVAERRAGAEVITVAAADAGTAEIVVDGSSLGVLGTDPADGWTAIVEIANGRELEISFRGPGRVDLNVELEDGEVRARVRDRRTGTETETVVATTGAAPTSTTIDDSPTSTTIGDSSSTTSTTIDDSPTSTTTTPVADPGDAAGDLLVVPAAEVGSVHVRVGPSSLTVVSTATASGWNAVVEVASGREVEVSFRGAGRVDVNVELEDGEARVRVRDRRTGAETTAGAPSPEPTAPTTETTVPTPTTDSTTPASTTTPTTEPAPTTVPTPPAAETRSWQLVGGAVSIRFEDGGLTLLSATPNQGFESRVSSSSQEIEVRFEHDDARSRLRVRVDGGRLDVRVEND